MAVEIQDIVTVLTTPTSGMWIPVADGAVTKRITYANFHKGVSGGKDIRGGSAAGQNLDLRPNDVSGGAVRILSGGGTAIATINGAAPINSLVVDPSGRLGVRNGAPSQALHVAPGGVAFGLIEDAGGANAVGWKMKNTQGDWDTRCDGSGNFQVTDVASGAVQPLGVKKGATAASIFISTGGRVGINTTAPATSAVLEIVSTVGAVLFPRMSTTQRNALTAINGMGIYNTTTNQFEKYQAGAWVAW